MNPSRIGVVAFGVGLLALTLLTGCEPRGQRQQTTQQDYRHHYRTRVDIIRSQSDVCQMTIVFSYAHALAATVSPADCELLKGFNAEEKPPIK